jgi:membrane associated rhomboid family serine protease
MTPWVKRLIIANAAMYFLQLTVRGVTEALWFVPRLVLHRPWTLVTHMFLHDPRSFMHILFNMIGLYFFGSQVESRLRAERFVTLYFVSGISGAALSFVFAPNATILGASGAVYGVMLAFARYWPRQRILIWGILPVEARVFVIVMTALSLWSGATGSRGGVADFAHLGGFAGAWAYLAWLDRHSGVKRFRSRIAPPPTDLTLNNWKSVDPASVHEINRDELNRILDKVSARGVSSLTPDERAFLRNFVPPDDRPPLVS